MDRVLLKLQVVESIEDLIGALMDASSHLLTDEQQRIWIESVAHELRKLPELVEKNVRYGKADNPKNQIRSDNYFGELYVNLQNVSVPYLPD